MDTKPRGEVVIRMSWFIVSKAAERSSRL